MRGSLLTLTWMLSKFRLQTDELVESILLVDWKLNWVFWLSIIRVRLKVLYVRSGWHHKRLSTSQFA